MKCFVLILITTVFGCFPLFSQNNESKKADTESLSVDGEFFTRYVHSPGLEDNLLGDSPLRDVSIYLPPEYSDSTQNRYPVIYFLHGYTQGPGAWGKVDEIMNTLLSQGKILPMIAVCPNSNNKYRGSNYTNSSVTGNWEDFIVQDVVKYIDRNFHTLPQSSSRGIAGFSMGGYGTIKLAMKHPDIFGSAYCLSSGKLIFEDVILDSRLGSLIAAVHVDTFDNLNCGD